MDSTLRPYSASPDDGTVSRFFPSLPVGGGTSGATGTRNVTAAITATAATAADHIRARGVTGQKIQVYPNATATPTWMKRMTNMMMENGRWMTCQ